MASNLTEMLASINANVRYTKNDKSDVTAIRDVLTELANWSDTTNGTANAGNTLIVSSAGTTTALGATRGSISTHFNNINDAWNAAQAGDTIFVFPGAWSSNNAFSGKDVHWYFMPGASMTGGFSWLDGGLTRLVNIGGYGEFSGTGNKFNITGANSVFNVSGVSISTTNVAIQMNAGTAFFDISEEITSSSGATFYLDGNSTLVFNGKDITNTRTGNAVTTMNRSGARIIRRIHNSLDTSMQDRPNTHNARLKRHVQRA